MRVLALALALVGAAISAVVVATTLPSGGPFVPTWVIWPLFVGCLLVHVQTVRTARADFKRRLLEAPRLLLAAAGLLAACVFALTMHALFTTRGNPERHGVGYYLRDHTELTRVSRAEYRYAERLVERDFVGIALVFYLAGILVHYPAGGALGRRVAAARS
jgi:quinol-cytochrome oxidoreductase complex cytochrome b subunit